MIFNLGYLFVMTYSSKKIDRYILVLFPMFAYFAVLGFMQTFDKYKNKYLIFGLFAFLFIVVPLFKFYPNYFLYVNPFFGSTVSANKIIGQKAFGVGIHQLKDLIMGRYGETRVGMFDIKPLEAIYPNSKVFDIRVAGESSYDILVLAINEDIPLDLTEKFEIDTSLNLNGLEYYKVYVKKTSQLDSK